MPLTIENELAHRIIGFAIEIHKALGPGLEKDTYRECLMYELEHAALPYETWKTIPAQYKELNLENAYLIDILVDEKVIILVESNDSIADYNVLKMVRLLKNGSFKLGLIINFNSGLMKDGIRRVTNNKLIEKEIEQFGLNSAQEGGA